MSTPLYELRLGALLLYDSSIVMIVTGMTQCHGASYCDLVLTYFQAGRIKTRRGYSDIMALSRLWKVIG